jgi:hypothetical protein
MHTTKKLQERMDIVKAHIQSITYTSYTHAHTAYTPTRMIHDTTLPLNQSRLSAMIYTE